MTEHTKIDLNNFMNKIDKAKKPSLGRGLSALMGDSKSNDEVVALKGFDIVKIPLLDIIASRYQARTNFNEDELLSLSESIKEHGVLQPILVRRLSSGYELIAGERRFRASKLAEIQTIPAIIMDLDDKDVMEIGLIENLQRKELNPVEEAIAYKNLIEMFNYNHEQISKIVGKSRSYISNYLRILSLPESILKFIADGLITTGHAKMLVSSDNPEELANKIIEEQLNVREIESLVQQKKEVQDNNLRSMKKASSGNIGALGDDFILWEEVVKELYPNIILKAKNIKDDTGEIVIKYKDIQDLKQILKIN